MTSTVLNEIIASTERELVQRKRQTPVEQLDAPAPAVPHRFRDALSGPQIAVIAEFKRRSPSAGPLREHPNLQEILAAYEAGGASAASILTEGPHFDGSLSDLQQARAISQLPLLRKDFIIDPYQLYEARHAGADAVLLIVGALDDGRLAELHSAAGELGLDTLIEVHDGQELERALALEPVLLGINNRDLRDFTVDVRRTLMLIDGIPRHVQVVSESGIHQPEQLRELHAHGVAAVLVGESLMRAGDPCSSLKALRGE